jgi:hypothetical protein
MIEVFALLEFCVALGYRRFGKAYTPIFKVQAEILDYLTLEDGTEKLS